MQQAEYKQRYDEWCEKVSDDELKKELISMKSDDAKIREAFYRDLEFGTGGLRGIIGAGTNRLNVYTIAKASQGLAEYLKNNNGNKIAISYDSRIKSKLFSRIAAEVFAANGIDVYIYPVLMPTPCLSFAVRYLHADAGVMVTASHNPAMYNGYKIYNADGCQITLNAASEILKEIERLRIFEDIKQIDFAYGLRTEKIRYISDDCYTEFIKNVKSQSVLFSDEANKNISIVYSPLNGTGLKPIERILRETGYNNLTIVEEQKKPDGSFKTCPSPNPENKEAMRLGMEYAEKIKADLLLATDPDCDRVGVAVRCRNGMKLLTGNEVGILLFNYICAQRRKHDKMPETPVAIKTIVTTDLAECIASDYGVQIVKVLTGFKYIGEQIGFLEEKGEANRYIFGFEESYGYLSGSYVRDKDAVNAVFIICEMVAYYRRHGITLIDKKEDIYKKYGYYLDSLCSFFFEGEAGLDKMHKLMEEFRNGRKLFEKKKIAAIYDYSQGINGLPKENAIKFVFDDDSSVTIRPSGTEPKLKTYISIRAESRSEALLVENAMKKELKKVFV